MAPATRDLRPTLDRLGALVRPSPRLEPGAPRPTVAVLGAGFAGIGMAVGLIRAGFDRVTIFEKNDGVGGTWRDNSYPGAACDVPSHLYSFSFEPKPDWSQFCSPQQEILGYLEDCVDRYGLRPHLRCGVEIVSMRWDDEHEWWVLTTDDGTRHTAHVVVSGLGQLNRPLIPDIDGRDRFEGTTFHSARWNHDHDLTGERVAVIGNGASAVQFVPQIAPAAEHLTVYQRSAYWILPRHNLDYPAWVQHLFSSFPLLQRVYRASFYLRMEALFAAFRDPAGVASVLSAVADRYRRRAVPDPDLRAKLTPDYPLGCKRLLFSSDYYPAVSRDDVEVVDDPIVAIEPDAVVTAGGVRRPTDTIIWATGFAATEFLAPLEVTGRGGRRLDDAWADGAEAYLGMGVAGFPNLFLLYGPNTNLGHNSIVFMIERQVEYLVSLFVEMSERGLRWVDVDAQVFRRFNDQLQRELARTVWAAGCDSWYRTEDGRVTNNWPRFTVRYWWETRVPELGDYATAAPVR